VSIVGSWLYGPGPVAGATPASPNTVIVGQGTPLSFHGFGMVAVDDAHEHVFVTGDPTEWQSNSTIAVLDFSGNLVTTITGEQGASFMLVDEARDALYVSLSGPTGAVARIDLDTLTETARISLDSGYNAWSLAEADGSLWTSPQSFALTRISLSLERTTTYIGTKYPYSGLLAGDPADPDILIAQDWAGSLTEYDVSVNPPVKLITRAQAGGSAMVVTPDGRDIIMTTGPIGAFRVSDLSDDGTYGTGVQPTAVAVSADGRFVAGGGNDPMGSTGSVGVFNRQGGSPVNDLQFGSDSRAPYLGQRSLAFSDDARELFVITVNNTFPPSLLDFHVVSNPTFPSSSIGIQASPTTISPPGGTSQLSGRLILSDGHSAKGKTIHVLETPPGGSQTEVAEVVAEAHGAWAYTTPSLDRGGPYEFEARWDGDGGHAGTSASVTVTVERIATTLTLTPSAAVIGYQQPVTVTAHLSAWGTNDVVSIYRTPVGGAPVLAAQAPVDALGDLSVTVALVRNNDFVATYDGDDVYAPAASPHTPVGVKAGFSSSMVGGYTTSGGYRLYHYTANCHAHHTGCPTFATTVAPHDHRGDCVHFQIQYHNGSGWHSSGTTGCVHLNASSKAAVILVYSGTGVKGVPFRIRAQFNGDAENAANVSNWHYFKITS
jgi:hypothetical protein